MIKFSFAGVEKTIPVTPGMTRVERHPAADARQRRTEDPAGDLPIDGELAHERVCNNIVFGDVWYVAGSEKQKVADDAKGTVRVMTRRAKRDKFRAPSRFSVAVSTTPGNRFASEWGTPEGGFVAELAKAIQAKTKQPVGIIYMNGDDLELKHWIGFKHLKDAPSLVNDYKDLAGVKPGNPYYDANVRNYLESWKKYWNDYITQMIATKRVPDGVPWGSYPTLAGSVETDASQSYNIMVYPFTPCSLKGIVFLCGANQFEGGRAANYGPELSALANSWKEGFGDDPRFIYTIPSQSLAPKVTRPENIQGKNTAVEINSFKEDAEIKKVIDAVAGE